MKHDVRQIRVGKHDFGIIGLNDAIEKVAAAHQGAPDDVIADALLEALKKHNYITDNMKDAYKQAFLREYRKYFGLPVTASDGENDELTVTVVGAGCSRCENLEMEIMMVLSELELPARVDRVVDLKEIAKMGIVSTPAVLIKGKVKCSGVVPSKSQLIKWFTSRSSA